MDQSPAGRSIFQLGLLLPLLLHCGGQGPAPVAAPRRPAPCASAAVRAARLAARAFAAVREERRALGIPIDFRLDPAGSGLIGLRASPVTTVWGNLAAKQTTVNPNWAAAIVELLQQAGVKPGDRVAVGLSGSFPALNIATLAALQALKVEGVVIASVGASRYGANVPGLTWPEMERLLNRRKILSLRSVAMSLGGRKDRAPRLTEAGRQQLLRAIRRHGARPILTRKLAQSIEQRMALFRAGRPVAAYINVGGGAASVGDRLGKLSFRPGLNRTLPAAAADVDSVMTRFARQGVPVLHLIRVRQLARRLGLPLRPQVTPRPRPCPGP